MAPRPVAPSWSRGPFVLPLQRRFTVRVLRHCLGCAAIFALASCDRPQRAPLLVLSTHAISVADRALSRVGRSGMPAQTVRLSTPPAAIGATLNVLVLRDRLEVVRVDAPRITADVVEHHPDRNRSDLLLVHRPVNAPRPVIAGHSSPRVAAFHAAGPHPTVVRPIAKLGEYAFEGRHPHARNIWP
jgi:hypothetical protein